MPDLFEHAAQQATRLRDTGMANAAAAQERRAPKWSDRAYAALVALATRQPTVHIDDFLSAFPERAIHPNAAGAIWMRARRMGILVPTGELRPCLSDPGKHCHNYAVYRSTLYRRGTA